jgi:hypothetical protein
MLWGETFVCMWIFVFATMLKYRGGRGVDGKYSVIPNNLSFLDHTACHSFPSILPWYRGCKEAYTQMHRSRYRIRIFNKTIFSVLKAINVVPTSKPRGTDSRTCFVITFKMMWSFPGPLCWSGMCV